MLCPDFFISIVTAMPDRIKTGQTFFQRYVSTLFGTDDDGTLLH